MKFIYRGIRYQSCLHNSFNSDRTRESNPGTQSKPTGMNFYTYRGVSYIKYPRLD